MARRSKAEEAARRELSPRKARICTVETCRKRHFGDLDWECPEHPGKTVDQPDQPYRGRMPRLADRGDG